MSGMISESILKKVKNPLTMLGRMTCEEHSSLFELYPLVERLYDWYSFGEYWYHCDTLEVLSELTRGIFCPEKFYDGLYDQLYEDEMYYWFKCPNGQTIKIAERDLHITSKKCTHKNCVHYRRAVLTKFTPHARLFARLDIGHIIKYHREQLFDLPHYGAEYNNYQNLPKW